MYFSDTLKNAYKNRVKYLYTEKNTYTGIVLKDDPAVALIQIKNEAGVFWWTISSVKPEFEKIIMQKFYQEIHDYYRNNLGCVQLINANNWKTADANLLFDAERYSNTSSEVLAVNRYNDPGHVGENSGWRINPGHYYVGNSVLFEPHKLPVNIKQVKGYPMLVTESA